MPAFLRSAVTIERESRNLLEISVAEINGFSSIRDLIWFNLCSCFRLITALTLIPPLFDDLPYSFSAQIELQRNFRQVPLSGEKQVFDLLIAICRRIHTKHSVWQTFERKNNALNKVFKANRNGLFVHSKWNWPKTKVFGQVVIV